MLTREGYFTVETAPIPKVPLSQLFPESLPLHVASSEWEFILDTQPTEPSSFTAFKTTQRDVYDSARARVGLESYAEKKEVLMWNSKREIMEGSLTSIFVWRGEEEGWYAPVVSSGGQQGTSRRWVLETGLAHEGVIKTDELVEGAWVAAGNGVRGFWGGRIA